jgi:hypothetical protein
MTALSQKEDMPFFQVADLRVKDNSSIRLNVHRSHQGLEMF